MAIITKSMNNGERWWGCGEKGSLLHCWWECKLIQPLWRTVRRFLKKLKMELLCGPAISLLGIYSEKNIIHKDTCTPVFAAALFTTARTWKEPRCPSSDEWMKIWVCVRVCVCVCVHTHTLEYYLAIKRNEIGLLVDGTRDHQTEWSKLEKNKHCILMHLRGI